jgi:formylglycine-generating enzyme required for sulfatase activity
LRGGSWNNKPDRLRSANRNRNNPDNRNNNIGFRLAHYPRQGSELSGLRIRQA